MKMLKFRREQLKVSCLPARKGHPAPHSSQGFLGCQCAPQTPQGIHPVLSRAAGIVLGITLDHWFGDPKRHHPVALFGQYADWIEKHLYYSHRIAGVVSWTAAVAPITIGSFALQRYSKTRTFLDIGLIALGVWVSLGSKSLTHEGQKISALLESGQLDAARIQVKNLVGRDTSTASSNDIARATVESLAENTSDAIIGTITWAALAGLSGALTHRTINTLDAMWGHLTEHYAHYGWAAARSDDLFGLIPARITAVAVTAEACRQQRSLAPGKKFWSTIRREDLMHPSPNAGVVEASFANALQIRLGGVNHYASGISFRGIFGSGPPAVTKDIARTNDLVAKVTTWVGAGVVAGLAAYASLRRR